MNLSNINRSSISNILIGLCFIATAIVMSDQEIYQYGINRFFLDNGEYDIFIFQLFSGTLMHGGILHLLANCIFIFLFGNIVESVIGRNKYIIFFVITVIITGISLVLFSNGNTVGISGFAMALLGFFTVLLYRQKNSDYKGGITAIIINVAIGLSPGISLIGHLSGVIIGVIYGFLYKK